MEKSSPPPTEQSSVEFRTGNDDAREEEGNESSEETIYQTQILPEPPPTYDLRPENNYVRATTSFLGTSTRPATSQLDDDEHECTPTTDDTLSESAEMNPTVINMSLPVAFAVNDADVREVDDDDHHPRERNGNEESVPEYLGELVYEGYNLNPHVLFCRFLLLTFCIIFTIVTILLVTELGSTQNNPSAISSEWVRIGVEMNGSLASWNADISNDGKRFVVNGLPVKIYSWAPYLNAWSFTTNITTTQYMSFVALSPDGTKLISSFQTNYGFAIIFSQNSTNNWSQLGRKLWGETDKDHFGRGIDITDSLTIAIGCGYGGGNYVKVFKWKQVDWNLEHRVDGGTSKAFGFSLSMSSDGTKMIVGAPASTDILLYAGSAFIYDFGANLDYIQRIDGEDRYGYFGAVSMSNDGSCVAIGSRAFQSMKKLLFNGEGSFRIYKYSAGDKLYLQVGSSVYFRCFYTTVSISGDGSHVAVGYLDIDENENYVRKAVADVYSVFDTSVEFMERFIVESVVDANESNYQILMAVSISGDGTRVLTSTYKGNKADAFLHIFEIID